MLALQVAVETASSGSYRTNMYMYMYMYLVLIGTGRKEYYLLRSNTGIICYGGRVGAIR